FLHRDPAAGRGQHAGRRAVETAGRRPPAGARAWRRLPVHRRAVHAARAPAALARPAAQRHRRSLTMRPSILAALASACLATACSDEGPVAATPAAAAVVADEFHGTLEPFASHAVYFVVTDRFV